MVTVLCANPVMAIPLPGPFPGEGPSGQDTEAAVEAALFDATGMNIDVMEFAKVNSPSLSNGGLTVTYDGGAPSTTGTWNSGGVAIAYISLKAATEFLLFDVGGATSGSWDTTGITNQNGKTQTLSHITGWKTTGSVAEPATLALFGMGLLGLAGLSRRKFSKQK